MKKLLSLILCLSLLVSLAGFASAEAVATQVIWDEDEETILLENYAEYGEGEKSFVLEVACGNECAAVTIHTDAQTVGEALLALDIVAGEDGAYGLYIKTVNGITADYDTDGTYWAFYINGEYAMTGVDSTAIDEESVYALMVEGAEPNEDETITLKDGRNYGFGEKRFVLQVIAGEDSEANVTVCTDAQTVGEALLALNIVAGEDGAYGLYVKTVSGVTADYDTDGTYWAFYIDGEYAMTGVDSTVIDEESVYTLKVEG